MILGGPEEVLALRGPQGVLALRGPQGVLALRGPQGVLAATLAQAGRRSMQRLEISTCQHGNILVMATY